MKLPDAVQTALTPLFATYPIDAALGELVPKNPGPQDAVRMVREISGEACIASNPALLSGLWLYVDELDKSHEISQQMKDKTGSFWHAIMHRREGDFWNSKYWFDRCGAHPAMMRVEGYDPFEFVDAVEAAYGGGGDAVALAEMQRREWESLFSWCAETGVQE